MAITPRRRTPGIKRKPASKPATGRSTGKRSSGSGGSKSSGKGGGTSGRTYPNGERVLLDLGQGQISRATQRLATKAGLTAATPIKGESGRYKRGAKGAKSITLIFSLASKSAPGNRMALPVAGNATIDDYIRIAGVAKAEGFVTPDGVSYPVGKAGGSGSRTPRASGNKRATPAKKSSNKINLKKK